MYANYFYDTSVIFSNSIITYRELFTICIGHDRRTDVIGIDWYIHQTCTNCSSWHDLLIPRGGLCPWPLFHAWVTMVRKKWLSPYFSTYWCYIHQTCTNYSSWHDLLILRGGLCPWPTFQASVTKTQNGYSGAPVMVPITIMSSLSLTDFWLKKTRQVHSNLALIPLPVKVWTQSY